MLLNSVLVLTAYMSFGNPADVSWTYLFAAAVLIDAVQLLIKPLKINLPVIGLADIRNTADTMEGVQVRKDGKPFGKVKDMGGYL